MSPTKNVLLLFLFALLQLCLVLAAPTKPSVLSISVRDIVKNDFSAYEADPNFELYTRWLETPQGSYVQRDANAAFVKHPNIARVDCHSDLATCLLTSRVAFADLTNSQRDLESLKSALEERTGEKEDSAALFARAIGKRSGSANTLYASHHLKTYHDLGPDNEVAGFQHYIVWDLKCQTLQYSSSGFQLTNQEVIVDGTNHITAQLTATLVGDTDADSTHAVKISITFACGVFTNKCCTNTWWTQNFIGTHDVVTPKKEPIECYAAKDVSKQNCESFDPGWCGVHIVQYQKNEGPGFNTENYRFDVLLYDADQELVGELDLLSIPSGQTQQIGSTLPYTFGVTAPGIDSDAVYMAYNGQSWGSNDQAHHCNFGKYSDGSRQGDCGFTC